jgi:hypothetical protein
MKNVWRILKQRLRKRNPYGGWSRKELQEAVLDIWKNEITVEDFNKYIDSPGTTHQGVHLIAHQPRTAKISPK